MPQMNAITQTGRLIRPLVSFLLLLAMIVAIPSRLSAQRTQKPVLHGSHWVAITGKPIAATAGAMMFQKGGNAVDAACAMTAATSTIWDTLSWGGETQALIYNPHTHKVIAINALGVAPTGATVEFYKKKGMKYPPEYGPLAAVTPGTPGGILTMLAEYGKLSLADVLAPAIQLADGYPIDIETANVIEHDKAQLKQWPYSRAVMLPHLGEKREAPLPGEIFRQPDLAAMLRKLVEAERQALAQGKNRRDAIYAAYNRFYKGDIAREFVRGVQEQGGLITLEDLARWKVYIEEPVMTTYKGIEVYKLNSWVQGPVMLQTLSILENFDLKAMGYNSARYIHTVYQAMNLAYADRDFYYGDPYFPPVEPLKGLLSKDYARERAKLINDQHNDPNIKPGDPYPFQGATNPYLPLLKKWNNGSKTTTTAVQESSQSRAQFEKDFYAGTTSVEAADEEGWVVSVTPSGGWVPAVIAGHTGVGLSQRMQSFVLDEAEGPFNVLEPGKRPRATLTPSLALKDGKPLLAFAVQGGDSQDQNLLQFFLDVVEFGMNAQEATEAPNFNSFQMRSSFGNHESRPGRILLSDTMPAWVQKELRAMGYDLTFGTRTSGPINAIYFDQQHGTMWGGSSNNGDDYGISW
ncbi:MAG: gamma-glutamyltranspeptidase / glutathione hydrolase [Acidobacteriota bacterium]|jgi:gamma-glutamyltranspeptidase/glutathione hydrolase|nr:gamma-glutamyltranspeptidase / glutathione hydrolase [Acidobacteriota bacterium]